MEGIPPDVDNLRWGLHHQNGETDVAVTQIDLDNEALAEVMRIAGVRTKKEAVRGAS